MLAEAGSLPWLLALIPAFLLAHYRRWRTISIALGVGMCLISFSNVYTSMSGRELNDWPLFFFVVSVYIALALGSGWLTEIRRGAEALRRSHEEMSKAYAELIRVHEELKNTQLQLIEAEKLDSVGRLAAGVAHEVKNPLMTILWGVHYLLENQPPGNGNIAQLLEDMKDAVKRADTVITGLLDFSAPHALELGPADLNGVVDRSLSLLKHEWDRSRITVVRELADDLPQLMLDRFKLEQVLVNILVNACHAINGGGKIWVRTYLRVPGAAGGSLPAERGDPDNGCRNAVVLEVDDTGTGVPQDKLTKIFDPFFTTKPPGKGTGLGSVRVTADRRDARWNDGHRES